MIENLFFMTRSLLKLFHTHPLRANGASEFKVNKMSSSFYGADGDSFDEIALEKRIRDNDGGDDHDRHGHADAFRRHVGKDGCAAAANLVHVGLQELNVGQHRIQQVLHVEFVDVRHKQGRRVPVVPQTDGREQTNCRDAGLQQRHHNLQQNPEFSRPVNLGRLRELVWNRVGDKGAENDHVPRVHQIGPDVHQVVVFQMQHLGVDHVGCNSAAAEYHGEEQEEGEQIPVFEVLAGKRVGKQRHDSQRQRGSDHGAGNGHAVGLEQHTGILNDILIGNQAEFTGDKLIAIGENGALGAEGDAQHQQDGNDAKRAPHYEESMNQHIGIRWYGIHFIFFGFALFHVTVSSVKTLMKSAHKA